MRDRRETYPGVGKQRVPVKRPAGVTATCIWRTGMRWEGAGGVWRRDDAMHFADGNEMGKGAGQDTRNYKQEDLYYVVCEKWINP